MSKKKSKVVESTTQAVPEPGTEVQVQPVQAELAIQPEPATQSTPAEQSAPPKKGSYDPERARAYREKLKAAAIAGGYVFKERKAGSGVTVKKVSKTGKEYYYQPWSTLTEEQKKARLEAARKRAALERELARKYKEEHGIDTKKEQS